MEKREILILNSPICSLLGIEYPIIQGGMAWVADADLAAAVSNAGGLGLIAAMNSNGEQLRAEIRKARLLTNKPFGVNVMLMSPYVHEVAQVVVEEGVKIVTTGAGSPGKYLDGWFAAGITVIPVVASVAQARMMERSGVSAVIAEGSEAGGHIGETTTMALIPQVADALSIPLIAAGGIGDGRGFAAVLMLGACAAQVGTRFLVAKECNVHENFKKRVLKARDIDTIATGKRLGHPVRCLKNTFSREYLKMEYDPTVTDEFIEQYGVGSLRLGAVVGDEKKGCFPAGQISGLVNQEQTAAEIIQDICGQAETLLRGAPAWVK